MVDTRTYRLRTWRPLVLPLLLAVLACGLVWSKQPDSQDCVQAPDAKAEVTPKKAKARRAAIRAAAEHSQKLAGWALLVVGGSILVLLRSSYLRPAQKSMRRVYWLFLPGWILLAASIHSAVRISGRHLAALFSKPEYLRVTACKVNNDSIVQQEIFVLAWIIHKARVCG
ncbi:MAG: hypothetical protein ACE5GX_20310 [Thermoanaerobaculia bacterium]